MNANTPKDTGTGGGKLLAGKYKDVPALEKAYKEANLKLTQLAQEKSRLDGEVQKLQIGRLSDAKEAEKKVLEAAQVRIDTERNALVQEMADAFDAKKGSPAKVVSLIDRLIQGHPAVKGGMSRESYDMDVRSKAAAADAVAKVRKAHATDFDLLKPKMAELWNKLPEEAKVPEMVETIYFAARAASEPDLREKIIQEMRSGSSTGPGAHATEGGSAEEKAVDAIIEEHQKGKKW